MYWRIYEGEDPCVRVYDILVGESVMLLIDLRLNLAWKAASPGPKI